MDKGKRGPGRPRTSKGPTVKTTVELPLALWRAAKTLAINAEPRTDLREIITAALEAYLKGKR
jgi:hypothetical protein